MRDGAVEAELAHGAGAGMGQILTDRLAERCCIGGRIEDDIRLREGHARVRGDVRPELRVRGGQRRIGGVDGALGARPALALVCAEAIVLLWEMPGRFEKWAAGALVTATTLWALYLAGGMAFWGVRDFGGNRVARPAWPVVSGAESRDDYVVHALPGIGRAEQWINANTSPDAKVALFDLTQGFYLDRNYVWAQPDHAAGLLPWDDYRDVDDWLADFKRRGYTTLLLGARDPKDKDDGKRWRSLMAEAIASDKVTPATAAPARRGSDGAPIYVRVYTIP